MTIVSPIVYTVVMTPTQLKAWREKANFSQQKLADILGVDHMTVSRWERGFYTIPPYLHFVLKYIEEKKTVWSSTGWGVK